MILSVSLDEVIYFFNFQRYMCYIQMIRTPCLYLYSIKSISGFLNHHGGREMIAVCYMMPHICAASIFFFSSSWKKSQSRREKHKCRFCPYLMKLGNIWKSKPQIGSATNNSKDQSLDDDNCKSQRHTGTELAEHSEWAHLEVQKKHNLVCNKENRVYGLQTWASLKQV